MKANFWESLFKGYMVLGYQKKKKKKICVSLFFFFFFFLDIMSPEILLKSVVSISDKVYHGTQFYNCNHSTVLLINRRNSGASGKAPIN